MKPGDIPPRGHPDRQDFVNKEIHKCINGVNINGINIVGSLYYELNYHMIEKDADQGGVILGLAELRDTSWIIHNDYAEAQKQKKHYCFAGLRQSGKTTTMVSLTMREINIYENTTALLLFANSPDIATFTEKFRVAHSNLVDFLKVPLLDKDFNKSFLRFGFKETSNDNELHARMYLYNTDGGKNTEVAAGKLLKKGTPVFYIDRQDVIENCKVGDKIFGRDGKLTTITGVFPEENVEMYEITLSDGRKVTSCKDHLWTVHRMDKTGPKTPKVLTENTEFLFNTYKREYYNSKLNKKVLTNRYKLPKHECLEYLFKEVTIDPYYLGLWLGDGTSRIPQDICSKDIEIIEYVEQYGKTLGCVLHTDNNKDHTLRYNNGKGVNPLRALFKKYNLINNKHIPHEYMYNSKEIRLRVLQGVMDSDGTIDTKGRVELCLSDKKLADDCIFLIRSLGINCSMMKSTAGYKKDGVYVPCKNRYRIYIGQTEENIFKLKRKADRKKEPKKQSLQFGSSIVNIKKVENGGGVCLSVDNEDKLFLVGDFIPTHNTLSYFAMDEIAKDNFIESWNAVIPAFRGKNGFRNSGMFTFTGGSAIKSQEAERFFMNPSASNILNFNGTGRFLEGFYRPDFKIITNYGQSLKDDGILIPDNSELYTLKYYKSDVVKGNETLNKEYDDLLKAGDTLSANKHKMYNPRKISDMFLKENANPFSDLSVHLEQLYEYLGTQEYHTQTYKLEESGDEVIATPVDQHYDPFSTNLDQPIVILDKPRDIENNVKIYVSGLDNVNVNKTSQSASKASFYVMRKPTSNYSDPWQETMVAWYNGRKDINDLREKLRLTLKYYGASKGAITLLHEAPDDTLTQWFMDKKIGYWLEDTYQLSKQIFANTKAFSAKGLRPTTRNQDYYISKIRDYLTEEMPDGRLGLWRIKDKLLVKQLLSFDGDLGICFVKDTLVTTINGYKKIQDINIGDLVLTHTGDYKPVIKLYSKVYNGDLINVKIKGNYRDIVCTPEHPFYVKTFPYVRYTKTRHDKEKEFYLSEFKWTNAEHLTNKDYSLTAYSNYKITCPLTEEELYVLGWFITDGYMTAKKRTKICFQGDQEVIAWKIKDIIEKNEKFTPVYFESTHHITGKKFTSHTKRCQPTVKKIPGKYAYSLECTSYWLSNLIDTYVITHKGGFKELIPEFVHYSNLEPFILGVFEGDGSLTNSILNGNDRYNLRISGTYINFIDQLYFILTNMKIDVGIGYNSYSDRINNNPQKNLSITNTKSINKLLKGSLKFKKIEEKEQNRTSLLDEKGLLKGIRKITRIPLKENTVVYNLEVADNNTYVVENQVVHNCDALVGFGHTLAHLYKERNYVARVSEPTEKPVSASDIAKAYSSGFGFNLPKSKKTKSMI
jgi:hypothetical protein